MDSLNYVVKILFLKTNRMVQLDSIINLGDVRIGANVEAIMLRWLQNNGIILKRFRTCFA